jgi:hypothetical protein
MKIIKRYPYRDIKKITQPDGVRHYIDPDNGELLPSVTTILSSTANQKELLEWRLRVGDKKADEVRDEATGLGTLMHTHLENHALGIPRPRGTNIVRKLAEKMSDQIIQHGLIHVDEIWGLEVALHAPKLYAGTTDLVGIYNGVPAIMDYKTTKTMKSRAKIQDYMCQASAYTLCHNFHFGTDIKTCVIFMVDRQFKFQTFVLEGKEFDIAVKQWEERVVQYHNKI